MLQIKPFFAVKLGTSKTDVAINWFKVGNDPLRSSRGCRAYLDFYKFALSSPPGAVNLDCAPLLGCCHPHDAVQEAGLLLLQLLLLAELRQEAGAVHSQTRSCTQKETTLQESLRL